MAILLLTWQPAGLCLLESEARQAVVEMDVSYDTLVGGEGL